MGSNVEGNRSVLDAGHRCDGSVIRIVGDSHQPRQFSVYAAVALAAISICRARSRTAAS